MSSPATITIYDGAKGKLNKRFNRIEQSGRHFYQTNFPTRPVETFEYQGMLKCKLMHGEGYSFIIPDQIYYESNRKLHWIQPLHFSPCYLEKCHDLICCTLVLDISTGEKLRLSFKNSGKIRSFSDGSELFSCVISGPNNLKAYATGDCQYTKAGMFLKLFHQTKEEFARLITKGGFYKYSSWNIQGTKKLNTRGYVYFTCLPFIICDDDLVQIGMSSEGKINLLVDNGTLSNPEDLVVLDVYRENCNNRTHSILNHIDASILAPQHVYFHRLGNDPGYYEVVMPFIYRVSMFKDTTLAINRAIIERQPSVHIPDHVIVGNASTRTGLIAPYDEEETKEILKIEFVPEHSNILNFWFDHGNMDHFTGKSSDFPSFSK